MEIPIELPLDEGFLRRECPSCERQFKWHHGATDGRPNDELDPPVYWCVYCGETAPPDHWWTQEQLEYGRDAAAGPAVRMMANELTKSLSGLKSSFIKLELQHVDEPEPPNAISEPSDMTIVESPCHPWEPVKVTEDWREPLYCLVCGERFAVA